MIRFFEDNFSHLDSAVIAFPLESKEHYAWFLAQTYYYVSHSTRLLALAAARFDVAHESLHHRFLKHTTEEKSHHLLASHDLKALGKQVDAYPELPMTAALYEPQYDKVEFQDPTALFGYIMALEFLAVRQGRRAFDRVVNSFGSNAASFLRVHSEEDVSHVEEGMKHLGQLDPSKLDHVRSNFVQTAEAYATFLKAISSKAEAAVGRVPAPLPAFPEVVARRSRFQPYSLSRLASRRVEPEKWDEQQSSIPRSRRHGPRAWR